MSAPAQRRWSVQPAKLAEIVAFRKDPITRRIEELRDLRPSFTMVGG